jgi:hypothetical protein
VRVHRSGNGEGLDSALGQELQNHQHEHVVKQEGIIIKLKEREDERRGKVHLL